MEPSLLRAAASLAERGVGCALASVVTATGSVPGKVGATMLVTVDGTSRGTVGGAGLEERVKLLCQEAIRRGAGGVHRFDLANWTDSGLDSVCGGSVEIAIHVMQPVPHLLLVGGGHCAQALARVADVLEWGYTVVDSRAQYARGDLFPQARSVVHETPKAFLSRDEDLSRFSHVYVMGHSHHEDGDAVIALLERGYAGVLGVIGSRSKLRAFRDRAIARGLASAAFDRVRSPIGVDVGAQTPPEIAVAVAAEVVRDLRRTIPSPNPSPSSPSPPHPRSESA